MRGFLEQMRTLTIAGILIGIVLVGGGGRLAMLVLRLTSPNEVRGVTSDDGFVIGRVTLGGTYNLLQLGAAVGLVGAGAYRLVSPWLAGPGWARRLTTGAASGAVVGSILLHADGVDFTLLQPTWLTIGLFIALPCAFGVVIGMAVDRCARPASHPSARRRWAVPILLVAVVPATLVVIPILAVVVAACVAAQRSERVATIRSSRVYGLAVRMAWMSVAAAGLATVVRDARAIA
ncbi:MAG: hypothetical protein ABIR68_11405 [Ilumatobacteraceae bacterium]